MAEKKKAAKPKKSDQEVYFEKYPHGRQNIILADLHKRLLDLEKKAK